MIDKETSLKVPKNSVQKCVYKFGEISFPSPFHSRATAKIISSTCLQLKMSIKRQNFFGPNVKGAITDHLLEVSPFVSTFYSNKKNIPTMSTQGQNLKALRDKLTYNCNQVSFFCWTKCYSQLAFIIRNRAIGKTNSFLFEKIDFLG